MKSKEINELISKLKEYDGELPVKVWSGGAEKDYPISHVGQGHTDGELDTYVSIVVDDDSNLVDLAKVKSEDEEAFCAVIDYCHCGICNKSDKCQLSPQHMCLRGRAYYEGFIQGAKLYKVCAQKAGNHPKNIWHDSSEEPKDRTHILMEYGYLNSLGFKSYKTDNRLVNNWDTFKKYYRISRWAYISDLLPKGGEK